MLLAPNLDSENAIYYAERIRNLVANYTFSAIKTITVSIGVAELQECEDLEHWIKRVDDALYSAKKNRERSRIKCELMLYCILPPSLFMHILYINSTSIDLV